MFTHHLTDYMDSANDNGFELLETREWFDDQMREEVPRLIYLLFRKEDGAY